MLILVETVARLEGFVEFVWTEVGDVQCVVWRIRLFVVCDAFCALLANVSHCILDGTIT